jgi:pentatricopeptide repeat protein
MRTFLAIAFTLPLFLTTSCFASNKLPVDKTVQEELKPTINYTATTPIVEKLPSPFEPLSDIEIKTSWGKELYVANSLAKEQDLYQAVTTFKRARILQNRFNAPKLRCIEANYGLLLSYYLGNKYDAVIETFEKEPVIGLDPYHPANLGLLVILYDSYLKRGETKKAFELFQEMHQISPKLAEKIALYTQIVTVNAPQLEKSQNPKLKTLISTFNNDKKSPFKAGLFNALLPGAGYYYVGQKQTAVTSFCLNALFIAAAWQFFNHGQTAAGIITTGFEFGWYFGGIRGANLAAKQYNNASYSKLANDTLAQQKLFPIFMLEYGF